VRRHPRHRHGLGLHGGRLRAGVPDARVDAVDLSADALEVARRNVARHGVGDRVRLLEGDCYGPVGGERYELIVSNPPYVSDRRDDALPPECRTSPTAHCARARTVSTWCAASWPAPRRHLAQQGVLVAEVGDSEERLVAAYPQLPSSGSSSSTAAAGIPAAAR